MTDARCHCGYLLNGLSGDRCPECGSTVTPSEPRRKKPYLLRGFWIGFLVFAVPTQLALLAWVFLNDYDGWEYVFGLLYSAGALLLAVGSGLLGMLIGYIVYKRRGGP